MNEKMKIMIVDDEKIVRESFRLWLEKAGHIVDSSESGFEALEKLTETEFDLLFVDIKMPGMDGIELLGKIKEKYPDIFVVIITAYGSIESAVHAMKKGATDYLLKPFKPGLLNLIMEKINQQKKIASEVNYLKDKLERITRFDNIIGQSPPMEEIFRLIPEVATSNISVLLTGETGTGKELVAKAIHAKSDRANHPFIAINCGAIPESLLESELFGYVKGAFTGAENTRKGLLEIVEGGTLFLDEIGEISPKMEVDLLRVLEEKKIRRVGSRDTVNVDFRLVSATSRNLEKEIDQGNFRRDLYYRINVINIKLPPLRERISDIPLLAQHFVNKFNREGVKKIKRISDSALELLKGCAWRGNVRELENAVERAVVLSKSETLDRDDFSFLIPSTGDILKKDSLKNIEKRFIKHILNECSWNITKAAKILDINRVTLHKKIKRYGFSKK
jgi:two-component system response regulator HydG